MEIKNTAIVGAGALGVMFGSHIARTLGRDRVVFVADEERIARYRAEGIYCNGEREDFRYAVCGDSSEQADLVIFATKYMALSQAIEEIRAQVHPNTVFISLINGIVSEEEIGRAYGADRVIGCIAQEMDSVKRGNQFFYNSMGVLVIGNFGGVRDEKLAALESFLDEAGICYRESQNIEYDMWNKLMFNTGINQISAVFDLTYGGVAADEKASGTMAAAMEEARAVASSRGIILGEEEIPRWMEVLRRLTPDSMPSMRQDTLAGRPTEVELFAGTLRRIGRENGVPTPVNDWLYEQIRAIEERNRRRV